MKRTIKAWSLLAAISLLTACALPLHQHSDAAPAYVNQQYDAQAFSHLVLQGNIEVVLNPQLPPYSFTVSGYPQAIQHLSANVKQQTFYLTSSAWSVNTPSPVRISLNAPQLTSIRLSQSARLIANRINFSNLQIQACGNSQVKLAGTASFLNVVLANNAHVDARRLYAQNAYINTTDHARADVYVQNRLNAFATGNSNIYYYQVPALLSHYMRESGSVLNMTGIDAANF